MIFELYTDIFAKPVFKLFKFCCNTCITYYCSRLSLHGYLLFFLPSSLFLSFIIVLCRLCWVTDVMTTQKTTLEWPENFQLPIKIIIFLYLLLLVFVRVDRKTHYFYLIEWTADIASCTIMYLKVWHAESFHAWPYFEVHAYVCHSTIHSDSTIDCTVPVCMIHLLNYV